VFSLAGTKLTNIFTHTVDFYFLRVNITDVA